MAEDLRLALQALLRKAQFEDDVDFLRVIAQQLMDLEVGQNVAITTAMLTSRCSCLTLRKVSSSQ